ncbi:MAG: ATP-binding cassette domain-containing protein, partial [bacterium]
GDDAFKKVSVLSGGEKSRLVLAKMILKGPNFLLLDEPTNHLDIPSRDCLQEALCRYSGTICMISHDRSFINCLANKIFRIEAGQVEIFSGDYENYLNQINQRKEREDPSVGDSGGKEIKLKNREQKRLEAERRNQRYRRLHPLKKESEQVQAELHSVLEAIDHLKRLFADPEYYQKPEFSKRLREYRELEIRSEELTDRWTELEEQIEAVECELGEKSCRGEI